MVKSQMKQVKRLKDQMRSLERELKNVGPVMRGSIVCIGMKVKQFYYSINRKQKTKIIFLGKKKLAYAKKCISNYERVLGIIEEMTTINMEVLKKMDIFDAFSRSKKQH